MKVIAIEIKSSKVLIYAIEQLDDGSLSNITGDFKSIKINDEYDNFEIREFQSTIHSFFDTLNPKKLAIIKRLSKGMFAASPVSSKLEGLIQCYQKCEVQFVSPLTLKAFYKKNEFKIELLNKYQTNVAKLAQYLIS